MSTPDSTDRDPVEYGDPASTPESPNPAAIDQPTTAEPTQESTDGPGLQDDQDVNAESVAPGVDAPELVAKHDAKFPQPTQTFVDGAPIEGHFVTIDSSYDGVSDAYANVKGLEDHKGFYGVWYSTTREGQAVVRLRDDTAAYVTVPIEALSRAVAGGR
ncbi:hypothetical protein NBH00_05220 [Paraconexibacter antarcticus]|uniref:Uncharacterized protein n=1 Tax=Paraconexibacter antarcticus TaxID=2949664 RepID=A0ABY5DWW3_9ACTN|nr:hypothetical protein [Paraconexibacter antarcticus]UTI65611.1 hypothetical protein NBH00_05220 [Paraconexibacter antarcticus]